MLWREVAQAAEGELKSDPYRARNALAALRGRRKGGPGEPIRLRRRLGRALGQLISQCTSPRTERRLIRCA